jgi:hypothetical protein
MIEIGGINGETETMIGKEGILLNHQKTDTDQESTETTEKIGIILQSTTLLALTCPSTPTKRSNSRTKKL